MTFQQLMIAAALTAAGQTHAYETQTAAPQLQPGAEQPAAQQTASQQTAAQQTAVQQTAAPLAASPLAAIAPQPQATPQPTGAPQVQVNASRLDQRRNATNAVATVTHDELAAFGDASLSTALGRVPGVTVVRGEVRLRGLGNGYTQLLLNGEPVPNGFALDSLPPDAVERIEVLRSPSADMSAQGIAGSINIVLRRKPSKSSADWNAAVTAMDGRIGQKASWTSAAAGRTLSVTLDRQHGARQITDEVVDSSGHRIEHMAEYWERIWLTLAPRLTFGAWTWQGFARTGRTRNPFGSHEDVLSGAGTAYPLNASHNIFEPTTARSDLTWTHKLPDGARWDVRAFLDALHRRQTFWFEGQGGADTVRRDVQGGVDERGLAFTGKYTSGPLVAGWDLARSHRDESRAEQIRTAVNAGIDSATDESFGAALRRDAVFVQWEAELPHGWTVSPGLRWEEGASPMLNALWKFAPQRQFRVGFARTYKMPELAKMVPRRYTVDNDNSPTNPDAQGNPALGPERAWGLDIAYEHYLGKSGLLSLSAYARRIDGVILRRVYEQAGVWITDSANAGRANTHGVELEFRQDYGQLATRLGLTRNWSRIEQVPGPDNRIDGQVPWSAAVGLDWRPRGRPFTMGANLNVQGGGPSRMSDRWLAWSTPSRLLDFNVAWTVDPRSTLRLTGTNLLHRTETSADVYDGASMRWSQDKTHPIWRLQYEHRLAN